MGISNQTLEAIIRVIELDYDVEECNLSTENIKQEAYFSQSQ